MARICQIKPPSVSEWRSTGIPSARRQFLELLRPDAFGFSEPEKRSLSSETHAVVDSRMSKRALRSKLGLKSDAHLARVLQLSPAEVEAWPEEQGVPARPQVLKLLGFEEQSAARVGPNDPDAERVIQVQVA